MNDQQAAELQAAFGEIEGLESVLESENSRKEELQVVVDDLHQQVQALLEAFNAAAHQR